MFLLYLSELCTYNSSLMTLGLGINSPPVKKEFLHIPPSTTNSKLHSKCFPGFRSFTGLFSLSSLLNIQLASLLDFHLCFLPRILSHMQWLPLPHWSLWTYLAISVQIPEIMQPSLGPEPQVLICLIGWLGYVSLISPWSSLLIMWLLFTGYKKRMFVHPPPPQPLSYVEALTPVW